MSKASQVAHAVAAPLPPPAPPEIHEAIIHGINFHALFPYVAFTMMFFLYVMVVRPQLHNLRVTANLYAIIDSKEASLWQKLKAQLVGQFYFLVPLIGVVASQAPNVLTNLNLVDFSKILQPDAANNLSTVIFLLSMIVTAIGNTNLAKIGAAGALNAAHDASLPAAPEAPAPAPLVPVEDSQVAPPLKGNTPASAPMAPPWYLSDAIAEGLGDIAARIESLVTLIKEHEAAGPLPPPGSTYVASPVEKAA